MSSRIVGEVDMTRAEAVRLCPVLHRIGWDPPSLRGWRRRRRRRKLLCIRLDASEDAERRAVRKFEDGDWTFEIDMVVALFHRLRAAETA